MIKIFILVISMMSIINFSIAQGGKKPAPKPAPSNNINKMIEQQMKQQGMSQKEIDEAMQMMQQGKQMAQQNNKNMPMSGNTDLPPFPAKQTALLAKIPVIKTDAEFNTYMNGMLADCKKNIPANIVKAVDDYFLANTNNEAILANLAPFLLLQQKPHAAIYAGLKITKQKPEQFLFENNIGVILHQTGYPEMAVPLFQHLLTRYYYSEILNNLAQCYLSLGDVEKARQYFMACIVKDPNHAAAHCGMGLILSHEGNIEEATVHIIQSLKNRYSETAEALMKKHKMKISFDDIKPLKAEYFNPQKYKPVPPARNVDELEMIDMQRQTFNELYQQWQQKARTFGVEQNEKQEQETLAQGMNRVRGYISKTPLSRKAKLITDLLTTDYYNFNASNPKAYYIANAKSLYRELEATMKKFDEQPSEGVYEDCKRKKKSSKQVPACISRKS